MWTHCITSISHVLKLNGYGGRQVKGNEKRQCFKGWETLVIHILKRIYMVHGIRETSNKARMNNSNSI